MTGGGLYDKLGGMDGLKRGAGFAHVVMVCLAALGLLALGGGDRAGESAAETAGPLVVSFSQPNGVYDRPISLALRVADGAAEILYTMDGNIPMPGEAAVYERPLHLAAEPADVVVVRARAHLPDGTLGPVASRSYFMGIEASLPLVSLIADPDDLWSFETGIFFRPDQRGDEWERPVEVVFLDENRAAGFQVPAGLRVHGGTSRWAEKKSVRLYFREEYGLNRLRYPLFPGETVDSFKRLVLHAGGQEYPNASANGTMLRTSLASSLGRDLGLYVPNLRPVLLFINGELYGLYNMRERIDRFFLADHYGIESADLLGAPFFEPEPQAGDDIHWNQLQAYVAGHDMARPEHYEYVQSQMDVAEFMDYAILQIYVANGDWPQNNTNRFRSRIAGGRWHWLIWDMDFAFGMAPYSSTNFNMMAWLFANEQANVQEGALLLNGLLQNPTFRADFLNRTNTLLNSAFAPERVIAEIDRLAAELEPDIGYELGRWPGSGHWPANVEFLRAFARQRPAIVREQMGAYFGLAGTARITVEPPAAGEGYVALDGVVMNLPWSGDYFLGSEVTITAVPAPGYRFAGWEPDSWPQTAVIRQTVEGERVIRPLFAPLARGEVAAGDVIFGDYRFEGADEGQAGNEVVSVELIVQRPGGVDLRGWRLTDNDEKTATDEGSLIFQGEALAAVRQGTRITLILQQNPVNDRLYEVDDLDGGDGRLVLYVGNDHLDTTTDLGFLLVRGDNLALLAPGETAAFDDDRGIAFLSLGANAPFGRGVTPHSFGILADGVYSPNE